MHTLSLHVENVLCPIKNKKKKKKKEKKKERRRRRKRIGRASIRDQTNSPKMTFWP